MTSDSRLPIMGLDMNKMMIALGILVPLAVMGLLGFTEGHVAHSNDACTVRVENELDQSALQAVQKRKHCESLIVRITSVGGEGFLSLEIARALKKLDTTVIVDGYCFSSCAEFILPAADEVIFEKDPLIGFHGNPALKEHLANATEPRGYENCMFKDADEMYDLYFQTDVNYEFWKSQLKKLELQSFGVEDVQDSKACPKMGFNFKHEMWFPSSEDLRNDFNLAFEGSVCADKIGECAKRVTALFKDRGTFVIDGHVVGNDKTEN